MGASLSSNVAEIGIDASVSVINSAVMSVATQLTQEQSANIACKMVFSVVDQEQYYSLDTSAMQTTSFQTNVQQQLEAELKQAATAIAQQIQFGSVAEANNFAGLFLKAHLSVANDNKVNANLQEEIIQQVNCTSPGVIGSIIRQRQVSTAVRKVIQNATATNGLVQDVSAIVSQTATAKIQDSLILIAIVAALVIVALIVFTGEGAKIGDDAVKSILNWKFALAVTPIVVVIVMSIIGIKPFISKARLREGSFQPIVYGGNNENVSLPCNAVCAQRQMQCGKGEISGQNGQQEVIGCEDPQTWVTCWCAPCDDGALMCNGACCPKGTVCSENQCKIADK